MSIKEYLNNKFGYVDTDIARDNYNQTIELWGQTYQLEVDELPIYAETKALYDDYTGDYIPKMIVITFNTRTARVKKYIHEGAIRDISVPWYCREV